MSRHYHIATMGCQMNEYDSDHVGRLLQAGDFKPSEDPSRADLILINTCTVRDKAEQKAYSLLGRMVGLKKRRPHLLIGVMGCIAQQKGSALLQRFPGLDFVIGTKELETVPRIVEKLTREGGRFVAADLTKPSVFPDTSPNYVKKPECPALPSGDEWPSGIGGGPTTSVGGPTTSFSGPTGSVGDQPPKVDGFFHRRSPVLPNGVLHFKHRVKSFVTIMEGCNNFCSYCIVPYVRGREASRPPEAIIRETKKLVEQGVKEVTLLGQNVNSYRSGESRAEGFSSLLQRLNDLEGLLRIRFTTSHPKDLSEDLIYCFKDLAKLCGHIHLPLQSGSNTILKSMKRGYTREHYLELVEKLRRVSSDVAITSDVIVGFPGETGGDFEQTLDVVKRIEFDHLFSFKYSDREGTLASAMEPKVPFQERAARLQTLQHLQKGITLNKNRKLLGQRVEVLVEGRSKRGNELTGRTGSNKVVNFDSESESLGDLVQVRIKNAYANSLKGELIH